MVTWIYAHPSFRVNSEFGELKRLGPNAKAAGYLVQARVSDLFEVACSILALSCGGLIAIFSQRCRYIRLTLVAA